MKRSTVKVILAFAMAATIPYAQDQKTETKSSKKKEATKKGQSDAEKTADEMLKTTEDLNFVDKWYNEIYPALKRKYKKPINRGLYDSWREMYYNKTAGPLLLEHGYGFEAARDGFTKGTQRQP